MSAIVITYSSVRFKFLEISGQEVITTRSNCLSQHLVTVIEISASGHLSHFPKWGTVSDILLGPRSGQNTSKY
jgi:hypothetical protein